MGLLTLPNELLLLIADHLPLTGVSGLRRTCRRIYRVLKKLNRRRIVIDDVINTSDLETALLNAKCRNRLQSATALEVSAITVLPPIQPRARLSLSSFLTSVAPNILYFSLYLVPECDVSYIPPPSPSTPIHPSLTHLSIINFRVSASFLAMFPLLVEATIALLLPPLQSDFVQLQYRPKEVQALLLSLPPTSMQRLTVTCTHLPVELLALTAQRFPNLTHLSFVWVDAPDRISGSVETTDVTHSLHKYAEAIAPLSNTLQSLYLPACVGAPTTKYPSPTLSRDDELLGEGPVLLPDLDPIDAFLGNPPSLTGYEGENHSPRHGRTSVGMKALLDACRTLVRGVGVVKSGQGELVGEKGMWELSKIGWLIPQGEGMPLLPIECVRRRGVVKFGATQQQSSSLPSSIVQGVQAISISNHTSETTQPSRECSSSSPIPTLSAKKASSGFPYLSTTYTPNVYPPRSVPITYSNEPTIVSPISPRPNGLYPTPGFHTYTTPLTSQISKPKYQEESEYWYPNMEWSDGCAWPAFAEIEAIFPRPECMRY